MFRANGNNIRERGGRGFRASQEAQKGKESHVMRSPWKKEFRLASTPLQLGTPMAAWIFDGGCVAAAMIRRARVLLDRYNWAGTLISDLSLSRLFYIEQFFQGTRAEKRRRRVVTSPTKIKTKVFFLSVSYMYLLNLKLSFLLFQILSNLLERFIKSKMFQYFIYKLLYT